jgi:hypothetical protein
MGMTLVIFAHCGILASAISTYFNELTQSYPAHSRLVRHQFRSPGS